MKVLAALLPALKRVIVVLVTLSCFTWGVVSVVYLVAWGNCNSDDAFEVSSPRIALGMVPCGDEVAEPAEWLVTVDHDRQYQIPATKGLGQAPVWMVLDGIITLHNGDNTIEYRAIRNGFVGGSTESITLRLQHSDIMPVMGSYTVSEVVGYRSQ